MTGVQTCALPILQDLFRLKFIQDKANVILVGGVGLGKSHLAIALAYAACEAGHHVRFTTAIDSINKLSAAQNVTYLPDNTVSPCNRRIKRQFLHFTCQATISLSADPESAAAAHRAD